MLFCQIPFISLLLAVKQQNLFSCIYCFVKHLDLRRVKMLAAKQLISSMVLFLFLLTSYAYAGTIVVNSTADTDARGDDITLREAIMLSEGTLNFVTLTPEEQTQVAQPVGRGIADTINFGITGTIIARSSLSTITDNETMECLDKAIKIIPDHATLWYNKGNALYELECCIDAKECYRKAKDLGHVEAGQMLELLEKEGH
jgi:tetratricopeptide (TPR) repeat protein